MSISECKQRRGEEMQQNAEIDRNKKGHCYQQRPRPLTYSEIERHLI